MRLPFVPEEQYRKKPLREQAPQALAIPPSAHRYNPDHIFRQKKKIPPDVSLVKNLKK